MKEILTRREYENDCMMADAACVYVDGVVGRGNIALTHITPYYSSVCQ